jgi:hypothetical protein
MMAVIRVYDEACNVIETHEHKGDFKETVIRVYDEACNVIETHEHKGDFKEVVNGAKQKAAMR